MKKILLLVLILSVPVWAQKDISIGAFGGFNQPILQSDAGSGSGFGVKAKFSPVPMIAASAFFEARSLGDPTETILGQEMSLDGGSVTLFGVEGMIGNTGGGPGLHFYWGMGIFSYKWSRDYVEDFSKVGYHLGPGMEIILPAKIGIEGKAKFEMVPDGEDGSRKNIIVTFGINYHLGII